MTIVNTIIAILAITAVLIVAMANEIDGVLLAGEISAIAGLGGYIIGTKRKSK